MLRLRPVRTLGALRSLPDNMVARSRPTEAVQSTAVAMKKNTQRIIAAFLVFLMIATVLAGIFASTGDNSNAPSPVSGVLL